MKINTTTNPMRPSEEIKMYPWLGMMNNMVVVLFLRECVGTVINHRDPLNYPLGTHRSTWLMDDFVPYYGEIRIESEKGGYAK